MKYSEEHSLGGALLLFLCHKKLDFREVRFEIGYK